MIFKQGSTRLVILTKKWAFKLPITFYKRFGYRGFWYRLLLGLKANIQEKEFNEVKYSPISLAKVYFYVPGGFLSIMKRGNPISDKEFNEILENDLYDLPPIVERKIDSFATIDGKIQVIDYA